MNESPYWWQTVPSFHSSTASNQPAVVPDQRFDVAVVGGGYTGLAAARALARAGAAVVVLERERIGWGASSRNGGQVLTGLKVEAAALVKHYGERRARELFEVSLSALEKLEEIVRVESIACEYARTGHVQAAAKPSHFAAFRDEQSLLARVFGHRVELVPPSQQRAEIGSDRYHGVLIDERSAAINPAQYADGLGAAAIRAGALVVNGFGVDQVSRSGKGWRVSGSLGGPANAVQLDAADVLIATNGYTTGASPALQRRLIPIGSYIITTEPLGEALARTLIPRRRMAFDSQYFLHYFRMTTDDRLLFGGRAEFGQPTTEATRRAAEILRQDMVAVFPELAGTRIDFAWSGNVAFTRDEMPRAGRLDDGTYYAGGYCGHGIAMATCLGELVGRRIAGEPIVHPMMDDRFPAIPLYRGKPWFLPIVGAYYRWLDWSS